MKKYPDLKIIEGIRKQDPKVLQYLYDEYFTMIRSIVIENSGNEEDARDIFQESIILIYRKITNESFQLTSAFKTYLFSVCWKMWQRELRDRYRKVNMKQDYKYFAQNPENIEIEYELHRRYKLYQEHFKKLGKECQQILKMALKQVPFEKIAKKLRLSSAKYVKKRKYLCKEELIKSIKQDKRYNDFYE
ncbi:MAG: RNA polymerase sigma factor [Bacteroidales bacterium]